MRFIFPMGIRSGSSKSIFADALVPDVFGPFVAVSDTVGSLAVNGRMFGVVEKAASIGFVAASNRLIGGTPRRSSIVRSTDTEEYRVESTFPVWVYGLI